MYVLTLKLNRESNFTFTTLNYLIIAKIAKQIK